MTMLAFRRARARAIAFPMPLFPPVTIATLPSSVIGTSCGDPGGAGGLDCALDRPGASSSLLGDSWPDHPTGVMTAVPAEASIEGGQAPHEGDDHDAGRLSPHRRPRPHRRPADGGARRHRRHHRLVLLPSV